MIGLDFSFRIQPNHNSNNQFSCIDSKHVLKFITGRKILERLNIYMYYVLKAIMFSKLEKEHILKG